MAVGNFTDLTCNRIPTAIIDFTVESAYSFLASNISRSATIATGQTRGARFRSRAQGRV